MRKRAKRHRPPALPAAGRDEPYMGDALAGLLVMAALLGFALILLRNAMGVEL